MTTTATLAPLPHVEHIEISNPDDPMGIPLFGGPVDDAAKFLEVGTYEGYGHGPGFEGPAKVRIVESRGAILVRSGWAFVDDAARAARAREAIEAEIRAINELRGETDWRSANRVSFGYIGNLYFNGDDDRSWSVFLPHPHRAGTYEDRRGSYSTHAAVGFELLLAWIRANRQALVEYRPTH